LLGVQPPPPTPRQFQPCRRLKRTFSMITGVLLSTYVYNCVCIGEQSMATSCVDLGDCFMLTQADVQGDVQGPPRPSVKQRRPTPVSESVVAASGHPARSGLARSATSVTPSSRPLLPVFAATDATAASTWLDDVGQHREDDQTRSRPASELEPVNSASTTTRQDDYDFHFALTPSTSSPSSSLGLPQQPPVVSSKNSRPVALVQPHKVTGVRVMPDEISASLASWSQGKPTKPPTLVTPPTSTSAPSTGRQPPTADRPKTQDLRATTTAAPPPTSLRDQLKASSAARDVKSSSNLTHASYTGAPSGDAPTQITKPYDFNVNRVPPGPSVGSSVSATPVVGLVEQGSSGGVEPQLIDSDSQQLTSKDREIASAVGNMKLDYTPSQSTLSAHGTNFEQCLGYFP